MNKTSRAIDWIKLAARAVDLCISGKSSDQALSELLAESSGERPSSQDRSALGDVVFQVLRHWRLSHALVAPMSMSSRLATCLHILISEWPQAQSRSYPARWTDLALEALSPEERGELKNWAARLKQHPWPVEVQCSVPDWLDQRVQAQAPGVAQHLWPALMQRAPVDLRVNAAKCKRSQAQATLAEAGVMTEPTPHSPWGLRMAKSTGLTQLPIFKQGLIEIQDEGSQLLAALVGARRGQIVVDFCAGAGGKTLALGAMMRGTGQLYAMDISSARLEAMKPRLQRAGLNHVSTLGLQSHRDPRLNRLWGKADAVLVDAPCSGLGTLRRSPELKWQLKAEDLVEHAQRQLDILKSAAKLVKPGGRLVYATCSFLREEDEAVALAFDESQPKWEPVMAESVLAELQIGPEAKLTDPSGRWFRTWPHQHRTDAFFASIWTAR